jgi:hypothetical protein
MKISLRLLCLACLCLLPTLAAQAQAPAPPKQTVMVPMRDAIKLATDIYLPEGLGPFPTVLARTPYNKDAAASLGADGAKRGYAMVFQDTRGRFASEGDNLPFESDGWDKHWDGFDTIEWLRQQPWCNGKIGTWGGSALGITQLLMAGAGPRGLTCQHITVGAPSLYSDANYPGGVFRKAMIEDWLRLANFSTNALVLWTSHPRHDDYWRQRELYHRWNRVNIPAVHVGGWFDIFAQGTLDAFVGYQTKGGPLARGRQRLLMGPWTHGVLTDKAGDLTFPNAKKPPTTGHDAWRWYEYQLKGITNGVEREPALTYYVMGDVSDTNAPGNVWRTASQWPPLPAKPIRYYFQPNRTLSTAAPSQAQPLTYAYDPKNPAPTAGGPQLTIPAGPKDQRQVESRADVLVFTGEPLTAPLEVTGRVRVQLWAASDAPDTDFFGKLCDVYPDGRSFNVCEGQIRARFRNSFDKEQLLKPGKVYQFAIDLWSTSIVFNRGHRLRVHVTSSSSPGYDPNPNTGEPFRASDHTRIAHNTVYVDARHPSHIVLPVAGE